MSGIKITDEEVQEILDNLYDFKDKVRESGNSKYIRLSNKDILFAVLKKLNDMDKKNCKQDTRLDRLEVLVYIGLPILVAVAGVVIGVI